MPRRELQITDHQLAELRRYADREPHNFGRRPNDNLIRRNMLALVPRSQAGGTGFYRLTEHGAAVLREVGEGIPARLRRLRLERGLSQRELAGHGVSYAYISRIESGTRQPSVKALRVLAEGLGVPPDYLEHGDAGIEANPTFRAMQRRIDALQARVRELEQERQDVVELIRGATREAGAKVG